MKTALGYEYTSTEFDKMTPLDATHYFTQLEQNTWANGMKESTLDLIEELKTRLTNVQELAKEGENPDAFLRLVFEVKRLRSFSIDLYDEMLELSTKYHDTRLMQQRLIQHFGRDGNS